MKEIVIDLFAKHPELRDRHGIGDRVVRECREIAISHARVLAGMDPHNLPDRRPRDYDDLPRQPVMPDDFEDEPANADPLDEENEEIDE